ncbi:MAG: type II secretion system protein GspG, partial [Thermodesulfovibrionales bacterium]|nr:type II secretion system protein GspG [Thermodesulfovibrionales bacterium]
YEFKPQGIPLDKELGIVLNTEHYLMEGVRMVDEWSEIQDRIMLEDVYVIDEEAQVRLDEDEQEIADYVDGVFDVADIADLVGKDSFTVASRMLTLEEKGAVYRMSMEEEYTDAPEPKPQARTIPFLQPILAVIAIAFFGVSLSLYVTSPRQMHGFDASEQLYGLRLEVQASYSQTGKYPRSMSAVDPWGNPVVYKVTDEGFVLFSSGPDSTPGTSDDVY